MAKDGKLSNAAVLDLDGAKTVELFLVSIVQEIQRISKAYVKEKKEKLRSYYKTLLIKIEGGGWAPMVSSETTEALSPYIYGVGFGRLNLLYTLYQRALRSAGADN